MTIRRILVLISIPFLFPMLSGSTSDPGTDLPAGAAVDSQSDNWSEPVGARVLEFPPPRSLSEFGPVAPAARQPQGALSGRIIYTSAGHGYDWNGTEWRTDRGEAKDSTQGESEVVEDLGNIDQVTLFAQYCFNAGATVVTFRPIGFQSNEVVLDNDDPGVTFAGTWSNSVATTFYGSPGDIPYRYAATSATETATARYTPTIPEAGFYPVYCWTRDGSDRVDDQLYRIVHTGGTTEARINHRRVGKGWIYLGTYFFDTGTSGYVEISNQSVDSAPASPVVIADAIRFGNGMGDVDEGGGVSGRPREEESSRLWVLRGAGQDAANISYLWSSGVNAPPYMSARMNREAEGANTDRVYLGFHSNASGGGTQFYSGRGTTGLWNNSSLFPGTQTPHQFEWAALVGHEVNDDLVAIGSPPLPVAWHNRGSSDSSVTYARTDFAFGEIRDDRINSEMDATIVEVAFHDNLNDTILLRDPRARAWVARACSQAAIRYFNTYGGGPLALPPETPTNLRITSSGYASVVISWNAPPSGSPAGDAATGYVVYRSTNGYGFGNPVVAAGGGTTSLVVSGPVDTVTYFRVSATNAGGESMPTETLAVRPQAAGVAKILVVNGFDRLDRFMNVRQTSDLGGSPPIWGVNTFDRVKPRQSNAYDYIVEHARAIDAFGASFDSCSNEAVVADQVNLANYQALVWILGEESTADSTFSPAEQTRVQSYLGGGGNLFVTGAEIGWDLVAQGNGASFYQSTLRAGYAGDDAGTYQAQGTPGGIFQSIAALSFDPALGAPYDVNYPDRLSPQSGAQAALTYVGGTGDTAAIQADTGTYRVVNFGFPFETITSVSVRNDIMAATLLYLGLSPNHVDEWLLF